MYSGIVCIDKPEGFTSFDVVAKLRGIYETKKIGHTGTLDPMATGVLCVCVGKATKAVELLTAHDKRYVTTMLLGRSTDTGDITGETIDEAPVNLTEDKVKEVILSFVGEYEQIPPMYSAKKVGGRKLCDLAREGKVVERKPVLIKLSDIVIEKINLPEVTFSVSCSSGTYIRVLCEDIGKKLGVPSTMSYLRRLKVGNFDLDDSFGFDELNNLKEAGRLEESLLKIDDAFSYKRVILPKSFDIPLKNGAKIEKAFLKEENVVLGENEKYLFYTNDGQFVGIYHFVDEFVRPLKMFI
ncbi:MAG: tRNA pseudouridine(55) synthase TruB [Lachnospiraceae bacterium]|nr:tRNA pseudouridine(55) synthase TruB [Lachnospiraceae bacterium]